MKPACFDTMRKALYLYFFTYQFFISNIASGQLSISKTWDARFGGNGSDVISSIQHTSDGGFVLGGYSSSGISGDKTQPVWGSDDCWIVKTDSLGNKEWDKDFGGTSFDGLYSIQQTSDGGYILGCSSSSDNSGDKTEPSWGGVDYWIIKIDSLGSKQWDKDFGGTGADYLHSVLQTNDGGFLLGGYSNSGISGDKTQPVWGSYDYWVVKTDSLGNKQWDKDFGGTSQDRLYSIQQTFDGGYIFGGQSESGNSGDKTQPTWGGSDYWILKTDSIGSKQWDKDFGGTGNDNFWHVQQTADSGFILGGHTTSGISGDKTQASQGGNDYWIIKTDSSGTKQWDKGFGGTASESYIGNIIQTSDGGYLFAGSSNSPLSGDKTENNLGTAQPWVVKTDSGGNKVWDKTIFVLGNITKASVLQTDDSSYVIINYNNGVAAGYKTQQPWNSSDDYWMIKLKEKNCSNTYDTIQAMECSGYISPSGNFTWTSSGNYMDIIPNASGCDSIITIQLTIIGNSYTNIYEKVCDSVFYISPSGNYSWSIPGTYQDTLPAAFGCDSVFTIYLSNGNTFKTVSAKVCDSVFYISPSGSYSWNIPGTYHDTIPNAMGCDSIFTINLSTGNTFGNISAQICDSFYISPSGNYTWTTAGTYTDTIANAAGCDSIITILLTGGNTTFSNISLTACDSFAVTGGHYTWTTSGIYLDTISNLGGCDSIITVNLTIFYTTASTIDTLVCGAYVSPSGSHTWNYSGTYHDTLSNAVGCDSVITIHLNGNAQSTQFVSGCDSLVSPSGIYTWTSSGTYYDTIPTAAGCDSILAMSVSIVHIDTSVTFSFPVLTSNVAGAFYQWINCDNGAFIAGASNRSFTPAQEGSYAVIIIKNGCHDTSSCYTVLFTGTLEEETLLYGTIYPNPAKEKLIADLYVTNVNELSFQVYDVVGNSVYFSSENKMKNPGGLLSKEISVKDFAAGIYLLRISTASAHRIFKFTVQH